MTLPALERQILSYMSLLSLPLALGTLVVNVLRTDIFILYVVVPFMHAYLHNTRQML